jgi:proteasome lid subunit RPN8/RPN11
MSNRSESPDYYQGKKRNQEEEVNIIWQESDDVYKPITKNLRDFMAQKGINLQPEERVSGVYINADALRNLKAHLKTNLSVEQGGILFGNAYQDPELGIYVDITAAVAAPATVGTGAHLDFTPNSWTGIMDYAKAQHPDDNIVGWYHSHPNLSAFMSGTDMNTQRAFFYHPWCLSIVYDPCREDMKFFLGRTAQQVIPEIYGNVGANYRLNSDNYNRGSDYHDINDNVNTTSENSAIAWQEQSSQNRRRPKKKLDILQLLTFLGIVVIVLLLLANLLGLGNIFNSQQPVPDSPVIHQEDSPFYFDLQEMSSKDFQNLSELSKSYPEYLNSSVLKGGNTLGGGGKVKLLKAQAKPSQTNSIQSVDLEYQEIDLSGTTGVNITDDRSIFDSSFLLKFSNIQENEINIPNDLSILDSSSFQKYSNIQQKSIPIPITSANQGFIFFMYSYDSNQNQIGSGKSVKNVIYIPNRIKYRTENTPQAKTIEIKNYIDYEQQ